jgi:hypothetical protein
VGEGNLATYAFFALVHCVYEALFITETNKQIFIECRTRSVVGGGGARRGRDVDTKDVGEV